MSAESHADFAARRARFRQQYPDDAAITAYLQRLATNWPERVTLIQHITDTVAGLGQTQPQTQPHVLELCCGPGRLATTLLSTVPNLHYTAIDLSPPFLDFARQRLADYAKRVTLIEADLSEESWPTLVSAQGKGGRFHAIVSLQSLHDVGDQTAISRVYGLAKQLLLPGGCLLNADLIVDAGAELSDNPGRLPIAQHLDLLQDQGYANVACTLAVGGFGCVIGWQVEHGLA